MISAAELAAMQADMQAALLPTSCQILRKTSTSDGMGGQTDTWATLSTPNCRVCGETNRGIAERVEQERLEVQQRFVIALPVGQDITERDRVVASGVTYEVAAVPAAQSYQLELLVAVREVDS